MADLTKEQLLAGVDRAIAAGDLPAANRLLAAANAASPVPATDMLTQTVSGANQGLAGGLGVPCWCLTPAKVAWRYGTFGGERMPWYNSVRLLRQQKSDDWGELIERTAVELRTWIAANAALKDLA